MKTHANLVDADLDTARHSSLGERGGAGGRQAGEAGTDHDDVVFGVGLEGIRVDGAGAVEPAGDRVGPRLAEHEQRVGCGTQQP